MTERPNAAHAEVALAWFSETMLLSFSQASLDWRLGCRALVGSAKGEILSEIGCSGGANWDFEGRGGGIREFGVVADDGFGEFGGGRVAVAVEVVV